MVRASELRHAFERVDGDVHLGRAPLVEVEGHQAPWRRIELALDTPTEAGETAIRLWSNLPEGIGAQQIAAPCRTRWRIEGMFQRLGSVLRS